MSLNDKNKQAERTRARRPRSWEDARMKIQYVPKILSWNKPDPHLYV